MNEDCLLLACDVAVRRALELAGKRMLTRSMMSIPGFPFRNVPTWLVYTRLPPMVDEIRREAALSGAWSCLPDGLTEMRPILDGYVHALLATRQPHTDEALRAALRRVAA